MAEVKWSVYVHICPNGKRYVGITSRPCEDRWRNGHGYRNNVHFHNAIIKYGWSNIIHSILYEDLTKEEAQLKERELIRLYESNNPRFGYNNSSGGEGKSGFVPTIETREKIRRKLVGTHRPEDVRLKLSVSHSGKHLTAEHKEKIKMSCKSVNSKTVLCLTTGVVYASASEASRKTGISRSGITACCRGETPSCKKHVWKYLEGGALNGK